MIRLIATDMDGTFLDSKKEFDPEFNRLFHQLHTRGIRFVVASGQQYYKLFQRFLPMSYGMYFVAENGTFIAEGSHMLFANGIERELVNKTLKIIDETPRMITIMCGTKAAYIERRYAEYEYEVKKYYLNYAIVDSFEDVEDEIIKLAIYDPQYQIKEFTDDVKNQLPDSLRLVTSGNEWMDIINDTADKGLAMIFLQEYLGIPKEQCAAFGDQMNDYGMLSNVKYAYAMDNAVDEIKAIAYEVIGSNEQQSVLTKIKEILQQNI